MAETEVESILREIRERVLSQAVGEGLAARQAISNAVNGGGESLLTHPAGKQHLKSANLALIDSYLATTARAWDRLPPVVSNRSGLVARVELWLKRRLKAGTRWFTWEQVNFNAAAHHALRDLLAVFAAYEKELGELRAKLDAALDLNRTELEQHRNEVAALRANAATARLEIDALYKRIASAVEGQRLLNDAHRSQVEVRLADLVKELRERDAHLREEQRVCFKQLSLEASEAAVLEDRARRKVEARLEELRRRVERQKSDANEG